LVARWPGPVRLAGTYAVNAKTVAVAVCSTILLVAVASTPASFADAYTIVTSPVQTAADALADSAVGTTPPFIAYAHTVIASTCVVVTVVWAQTNTTIITGVTRMAYALAGPAESVHIAVFQVCTRPVRAIVATPWRFAFTLSTTALAVPAALIWPAGQLAAIFSGKTRLAEACALVAITVRATVVRATFDGAVNASETAFTHAFPSKAFPIHAALRTLIGHAVFASVTILARARSITACAVARANGAFDARRAAADLAGFA